MSPSISSSSATSMSPSPSDADRPPGTQGQPTVEDYSRIMLQYTQRRMAGFANSSRKGYATSRSSRSSNASGQSGKSNSGILAGQAAGYTPPTYRGDSTGDVHDPAGATAAV
ncbi:hypothetical protein BJX99DRAFT_256506 [Aspergillus californicus]